MTSNKYEKEARELLLSEKPEEAFQLFEEGLRKFPGDSALELGRGMALLDLKRWAEAQESFEGLLRRHPHLGDALQGLAEAHLAMGQHVEAVATIQEACGPQETDADFVHTLAHLLYENDLLLEAIPVYRRVVELDRAHPHGWLGLASCLHRLRRPEEAIKVLQEVLADRMPGFFEGYSYLGCLLLDAGRMEEAKAALESIPLDEMRDPSAVTRLLEVTDPKTHPERARYLNDLRKRLQKKVRALRAKELRERRKRELEQRLAAEKQDLLDSEPGYPGFAHRFWPSDPTVAGGPCIFELENLFSELIAAPCRLAWDAKPLLKRKPTLAEVLQLCAMLLKFLGGYPWVANPKGMRDKAWRYSGAAVFMLYASEILLAAPAEAWQASEISQLLEAVTNLPGDLPPNSREERMWMRLLTVLMLPPTRKKKERSSLETT